ncbi:MAG: hypothetical protein J6T10_21505 [Methanobrevibacter sp.]|nr:hypothetical protein [Methanobrevibacter sp.]
MDSKFEITGQMYNDGELFGSLDLKDEVMYINLPEWIEERNIYKVDTKEQFATIKPKKFGGLTYRVIDYIDDFAEISTRDYGECLVKITEATKLTNYPIYERGSY